MGADTFYSRERNRAWLPWVNIRLLERSSGLTQIQRYNTLIFVRLSEEKHFGSWWDRGYSASHCVSNCLQRHSTSSRRRVKYNIGLFRNKHYQHNVFQKFKGKIPENKASWLAKQVLSIQSCLKYPCNATRHISRQLSSTIGHSVSSVENWPIHTMHTFPALFQCL